MLKRAAEDGHSKESRFEKKKEILKKKRKEKMTARVLKQDPNTERFKRTLIYFDMGTQYANFRGNPLC